LRRRIATLVVLAVTWPAFLVATEVGPPRVEVPEPAIDAGEVVQGERVEAVFEIRNAGESELAILSAKPG
jgi:hypothetical protein